MKKYLTLSSLTITIIFSICFACGVKNKTDNASSSGKELSCELNIYNREDYFGETTLSDFEERYGLKVNLRTFEDEEELFSTIQAHPCKFDIIVATIHSVKEMKKMRLLSKINLANIPNKKNIASRFKNLYQDPDNVYAIPYLWGTTGIIINHKFIKDNRKNWNILWNPEYKGKIAMLNSPEEVLSAGLKKLGYSLNSTCGLKLEECKNELYRQIPFIKGYFDVISIRDKMIAEELWAAQIYSGDGMYAADKNDNLEYIIPQDGAMIWVDCLAIPKDAEHKYTAEVFINYILESEISGKIANYLWHANCNEAAATYTDEEILESTSLYPPKEVLEKCEFIKTIDSEEEARDFFTLRNIIWSELNLKKEQNRMNK